WACRRAELTAFSESPFVCENGLKATMASIRTLPPMMPAGERLLRIGERLISELLPALKTLKDKLPVALVLCLSERFGEKGEKRFAAQRLRLERSLVQQLEKEGLKVLLHTQARGHSSLAFGLIEAGEGLGSRSLQAVIIGGVDSYYDPEVVE